jgi:DUF1009 family protein
MSRATGARRVGLIAGNGIFPFLFARGARQQGVQVVAIAHRGETDPALEGEVDELHWVQLGQLGKMIDLFAARGVSEAAMAGGIGKLRAFRHARPDLTALRVAASLRNFNDDGLLKAIAGAFEGEGIRIIASTEFLREVLAAPGALTRRGLSSEDERDVALGREVAAALGRADVGQTVVTRKGHVIAVEAAEGTDACIRRAGELAGEGIVVVKRAKPQQDSRFDLPAIGPKTIEAIAAVKGAALAVEAGRTVVLEAAEVARRADSAGIAVVAS